MNERVRVRCSDELDGGGVTASRLATNLPLEVFALPDEKVNLNALFRCEDKLERLRRVAKFGTGKRLYDDPNAHLLA